MNNDIKEILDNLQDSIDNPTYELRIFGIKDYETVDNDYCLTPDKCKVLLDYITNLQDRIDKALEFIDGYKERVGLTGNLILNLEYILKGE